jgi:DNA primase
MGRSKGFKKKKHAKKKKKRVKLEDLMDMAAERIQQKLDERQPTRDVTETVKKEQEEQEKNEIGDQQYRRRTTREDFLCASLGIASN